MSTINLTNYESFLLDYVEHNLTPSLIDELIAFIQNNPQLGVNLDDLHIEPIYPNNITYSDKNSLKQQAVAQQIVAQLDNELSHQENTELNALIKRNSSILALKNAYKKTVLIPKTVIFPNKSILKQKERTLIPMFWRWSAAAVFLGLVALFPFWNTNSTIESNAIQPVAEKTNEVLKNPTHATEIEIKEENNPTLALSNQKKNTAIYPQKNKQNTMNSVAAEQEKDSTTYIVIEPFVEEKQIVIEAVNIDELFAEKITIAPTNPFLVAEKKEKNPLLIQLAEKITKEDINYINKKDQKGKTEEYAFQLGNFSISKN